MRLFQPLTVKREGRPCRFKDRGRRPQSDAWVEKIGGRECEVCTTCASEQVRFLFSVFVSLGLTLRFATTPPASGPDEEHADRAAAIQSRYVFFASPYASSPIISSASCRSMMWRDTRSARNCASTRLATSWRAGIDRNARVSSLNPAVL